MALPLPPWIQPLNPAPYYLQGVGQGEQIAARQNNVELAIQEMTLRREAQQRHNEAQNLAAARTVQQMEIAAQEAQEQARQAAMKWEWQNEMSRRIAAGEDPITAWEATTARYSPEDFGSYATRKTAQETQAKEAAERLAETRRYHDWQMTKPDVSVSPTVKTITDPLTQKDYAVATGGGKWQLLPEPRATEQKALAAIEDKSLSAKQTALENDLMTSLGPKRKKELQDELLKVKTARSNIVMSANAPEPLSMTNAPAPSGQTKAVERVIVISPSGQRGYIPRSELPQALKEGYRIP